MNLTSPAQVKAWCAEHDFHPNRTLGQNFLIDRNVLEAIADAAFEGLGDPAGLRVLEVGPGLGALTGALLARGAAVVAVEKDPVLAGRLAEALGSPPGLRVVAGDALAFVERGCRGEDFGLMASNLPYQCGTRILLELVKARRVPSMTVLVQTEVAARLAAREGSKTRGLAGVWAQLDYDVKILRRVAPTCFWPRPAVGSSVVRLDRHSRNDSLGDAGRRIFREITKRAFAQRRKQLGNSLKDLVKSTARAEDLSNEDWIELTKGLMENEDS